MNKIDNLFAGKKNNILNIYCTAGYPALDSLQTIMPALQSQGADIIEVGIPYSDPIADGPVIQQSNMQAIENGMTIEKLFEQLRAVKEAVSIPVILMGYLNPVLQYGMENFCKDASANGVSGIILPDLPMYEYEHIYKPLFEKYRLHFIFLITPQTGVERIKKADALSKGFLYAVSSSATTGSTNQSENKLAYFKKLKKLKCKNPLLIGFGIKDKASFTEACTYANGAIIGTAYINAITGAADVVEASAAFISNVTKG